MPRSILSRLSSLEFQLFAILVSYCLGLWKYSVPFTGDEKVYISTAMEMWQHGDWLHPRLLGETSYYKPPFQYWATLAGWSIFGFGQFGTYIPSVLAVLLTAWMLHQISKSLNPNISSESQAPLAGLWFAACAGTLTYGTTAQMEIWIVAFYSGAWWAGLRFIATHKVRWIYLSLAIAGLSSLVKSPLYAALWVLGFWFLLAISREFSRFKSIHFWLAHLLGIGLGIAWFVSVYATDGERFWDHYVLTETLSKSGGNASSLLRFYGDFSTFLAPWIVLLLPALVRLLRSGKTDFGRVAFLASWSLLPLLFFSAFPYRTETYLYILVPALALVIDWYGLPQAGLSDRIVARLNGALIALGLLFLSYLTLRGGILTPSSFSAIAFASFGIAAAPWVPKRALPLAVASSFLILILAVRLAAISLGERDLRILRETLDAHPQSELAFLDEDGHIWHEIGLLSAAVGMPSSRARSFDAATEILRSGGMLVLNQHQWQSFLPRVEQVMPVQVTSWPRFQRAFQIPDPKSLAKAADLYREYKIVLPVRQ